MTQIPSWHPFNCFTERCNSQRACNPGEEERERQTDLVTGKAGESTGGYEGPLPGVERL